jgi:short-subunit dehydrogenase
MNVVVTGASKGIGKAVAECFAAEGADLFVCARHMDQHISWQNDLIARYGIQVTSSNTDMGDADQVKAMGEKITAVFEHVDILINNAGFFEPGNVHDEGEGVLERTMAVNLYSAYHLTRALLPLMIKRKSGHIFNICSIAALGAYPGGGAYSISKWAMLGFNNNLRHEMKEHGIKVTAVHPGATMTASWEGFGVSPKRIMEVTDISAMILAASKLSPQACVEEIILRPQLGDL